MNRRSTDDEWLGSVNPQDAAEFADMSDEERAERNRLDQAVDVFAEQMKRKLHEKAAEGWSGWNNRRLRDDIYTSLCAHTARGTGQWVDIANLSMMLFFIDQPALLPPEHADAPEENFEVDVPDELVPRSPHPGSRDTDV